MSNKNAKYNNAVYRANRELKLVPLRLMRVTIDAQRKYRPDWVEELVAKFDTDMLGVPEVSFRDGFYYIMDGQHRIAAIKRFLVNWEDQSVQCWVATGMTLANEAECFLSFQERKAPTEFDKYKVAVTAGRPDETAVDKIVRGEGLCVTVNVQPGAIGAPGALLRVYRRNGDEALRASLRLARDSFGDAGLCSPLIDGFGLLIGRYGAAVNHQSAVKALSVVRGGLNGLLQQAERLRMQTGVSKAQCVAAATSTIINRERPVKLRLPPWFKDQKV